MMRLRSITVHSATPLEPILVTRSNISHIMADWGKKPLAVEAAGTTTQKQAGQP
jgi:hypothetical protein